LFGGTGYWRPNGMNELDALRLLGDLLNPLGDGPHRTKLASRLRSKEVDWPTLVSIASGHGIVGAVAGALAAKELLAELQPEEQSYFEAVAGLNRVRNQRISEEIHTLAITLNRYGIEPLLLKSAAHLSLGLYPDPAIRMIGDIDLLVWPQQAETVMSAILALGYETANKTERTHVDHRHYPRLIRAEAKAAVEVHTEILPSYCRYVLPAERVWRRAKMLELGAGHVLIPAPDDLIIHRIAHGQLVDRHHFSAEFLLSDAYDILLLGRRFATVIDPDRLAQRITTGIGAEMAGFLLRRSSEMFGGEMLIQLPLSPSGRLADLRWRLHARGHLAGLQRLSRLLSYGYQMMLRLKASPAERYRLIKG
jgi:hypothetical protein